MKAHNGMRPHDIVVLLKIISMNKGWLNKDLAWSLRISTSEISESLNRSKIAGLISPDKKMVLKSAFLSFIEHGLRFVFPAEPGALVRGIPTGHSAPILKDYFLSNEPYVWPSALGKVKGQAIQPLYPNQIPAAQDDLYLYDMLALIDSIRVGRIRECEKAIELLKHLFNKEYA